MPWTQIYDPFGNPWLSTLVAALPIVLLLGLLASCRVSAPMASLVGLTAAFLTALLAYVPRINRSQPGRQKRASILASRCFLVSG
jgi:outer membrane PBP1 activator LpoA protein